MPSIAELECVCLFGVLGRVGSVGVRCLYNVDARLPVSHKLLNRLSPAMGMHQVVTRPNSSLLDQVAVIVKIPAATVYIVTRGLMLIVKTLTRLGRMLQP